MNEEQVSLAGDFRNFADWLEENELPDLPNDFHYTIYQTGGHLKDRMELGYKLLDSCLFKKDDNGAYTHLSRTFGRVELSYIFERQVFASKRVNRETGEIEWVERTPEQARVMMRLL